MEKPIRVGIVGARFAARFHCEGPQPGARRARPSRGGDVQNGGGPRQRRFPEPAQDLVWEGKGAQNREAQSADPGDFLI